MRGGEVGLLGLCVLCAVAATMNAGGCQPEGNTTGAAGTGGQDGSGAGEPTGSTGEGGEAREGDPPPQRVTIEDITRGRVDERTVVELKGVVAMSKKFFLDDTRVGECLWGVFLSSPGLTETAPHSGILAISRGEMVTDGNGGFVCPDLESAPSDDAFPDDVAPGDVLDVVGETAYFSSSSCRDTCGDLICDPESDPPETAQSCAQDCGASPELIGQSAVGQYQLEWIESVTRSGRVDVPAPHVLTPEEVMKLGSPAEADFFHAWGGVKVRLEGAFEPVLRTTAMGEEVVVGSSGNIHLQEGPMQVGTRIYHVDGAESACHKGPVYSNVDIVFERIDGFVYNNSCIWSLQPADKCADLDPPSEDCVDDASTCT